ncbi:AmmeMemoRadiSam system radical SAM enzyme [Candidatus Woesearchaeota archaeon]|nr:AmmeMemoRadiSam system radical SAM enzyme [Candidatus Woesearchaeota archaeon]MBW3021435.1 AmmeMemoRadiSam system radical SAM enzyme [Candidatus Woesearchaeota archaeon]
MKEALHYKKLKNGVVQCGLCPWFCVLKHRERGNCGVRINNKGKLYSLVYAKPCSAAIDPVEKKPLFHFMPGSKIYSIGTAGCNLKCKFCQNWTISQSRPEDVQMLDLPPRSVVENAVKADCKGVAYTYTEPTIFYEYVLDTAKIAHRKGLKNIMVTNGFINPGPVKELYPYIDAANIDLKGFTERFYRDVAGARLKPVLEAIKLIQKQGTFIELTNLLIPTLNDDTKLIKKMCEWIVKNLGKKVPLHFSRFFPDYQLQHIPPTPEKTLFKAFEVAKSSGLEYVYLGNLVVDDEDDTFCPKCGNLVIKRERYVAVENNLKNGKCQCGNDVPGVW